MKCHDFLSVLCCPRLNSPLLPAPAARVVAFASVLEFELQQKILLDRLHLRYECLWSMQILRNTKCATKFERATRATVFVRCCC